MPFIHAVYHPATDPEVGAAMPTVVAIHGHGANGFDLLALGPYLAGGRVLVLCPQAEFVLQPGTESYTWFNSDAPGSRSREEYERVTAELEAFIEHAVPHYGGDPTNTVVLGFSQGGSLAYRLGLGRPAAYRGVAALSTWLPAEARAAAAEDAADLDLFIQHGTDDPLINVERARESRDQLHQMGIEADYREYLMAHEVRPDSLVDLSEWLERVLDIPPAP